MNTISQNLRQLLKSVQRQSIFYIHVVTILTYPTKVVGEDGLTIDDNVTTVEKSPTLCTTVVVLRYTINSNASGLAIQTTGLDCRDELKTPSSRS